MQSTESHAEALQQAAIDRINWGGGFFDSLLETLSDEQLMARAGGSGNHPMWVMGHTAQTTDFILGLVDGQDRKLAHYDEIFGGGTNPSDDRSIYPSRDELKAAIAESRERLITWVRSLDESNIHAPVPDPLPGFAPDNIMIPFTIVAHDLFHLGQIATVRASLGLEPVHR